VLQILPPSPAIDKAYVNASPVEAFYRG